MSCVYKESKFPGLFILGTAAIFELYISTKCLCLSPLRLQHYLPLSLFLQRVLGIEYIRIKMRLILNQFKQSLKTKQYTLIEQSRPAAAIYNRLLIAASLCTYVCTHWAVLLLLLLLLPPSRLPLRQWGCCVATDHTTIIIIVCSAHCVGLLPLSALQSN